MELAWATVILLIPFVKQTDILPFINYQVINP